MSNPENRKKYDKYGKDWEHAEQFEQQQRAQQQQGPNPFEGASGGFSDSAYSDFFEQFFGRSEAGRGRSV